MKKFYLLTLFVSIISMSFAQYSITTAGATQTIDFTGFDGSGFSTTPAAGQLNSNEWEIIGASDGDNLFGQTNTGGDFARGSSAGGSGTGGIYSFDNGSGASLGIQPGGSDFTPGSMTLALVNNTGGVIEEIQLEYEVWVYNDQARANSFNFEHGSDNATFTQEAALDFTSTEVADASPAWASETKTITISGLSIADGGNYYLKWFTDDVLGGGSRDELAVDNISITGLSAGTPTILANPTTLTGFTQFVGSPSAEQSFEVSGTSLTADLDLVVTGDYEISETSGGTFGNSITLVQSGGTVAQTTIYVRLNGTTAASPSNGDVTITSAGATDAVVNLEGEILNPAPTIFASPATLTGFSHFVGTPSAEQTIDVSGEFLTADITVTAPTNYEVSTTSGSGFGASVTLTQSGGTVASTPVYVRLNGPAADYTQNGNIDVASTGATTEQVALEGETLDYTPYDIGEVTTNDNDLTPDSLGVFVQLKGIVHCTDFDGNDGYSFTIIDSENDGINVFNFNDVNNYVVTEGDSITVRGEIDFFNGLTQIFAEEIVLETQGNATQTPTVVTALDETTESQYITIEALSLVNNETTWPSGGNVDVTDGNNNFEIRIDNDSPLAGTNTPNGPFDATGLGGQFDNSGVPYDAGYQLYPCSINPLCNVDITTATTNATATANATGTGVTYQWIDCDDNDAPISGETDQTFTATTTGNYAVIITDGQCIDTSDCVNLEVCNVDVTTTTTDLTIEANASGLTYQWIDCDNNNQVINGETGQSFTATSNGNYAVIVSDGLCVDTSDCVTINTISLDENGLDLSVYPNPVKDELTISSKGSVIENISVISVTGKQVARLLANETIISVNTSNWKTGVYFIHINTVNGSEIVKVIK